MDIRIVPRALVLALSLVGASALANEALVFQTDFGQGWRRLGHEGGRLRGGPHPAAP